MSVYQTCAATHGEDIQLLMQCISNWFEQKDENRAIGDYGFVASEYVSMSDLTSWLLVLTGALIFFMQAGFAMVCAGAIRKKNLNNTVCIYYLISFQILPNFCLTHI